MTKYLNSRKLCWDRLTQVIKVRLDGKYTIEADDFHLMKKAFLATKLEKPCYICESSPCVCGEIEPIEIETDLSNGKRYVDGLELNQVDEFLINKINLIILFINSK